ncbi:MAG: RNA 2',3'-cyclic phosphodiesterase [Terriglobia bacterium]
MRLFVALELTEEVHAALRALVGRLKRSQADARWVRPEGMHLTLKFMGETAEEKLAGVKQALAGVRSPQPVRAAFRTVGYFPNERQPRVFWVGVQASDNLAALAADIEAGLAALGVKREQRAFRPHLTLARFKSGRGLPALKKEIAALEATEFGALETSAFHLFQSKLSPQGAQYMKLTSFPFVRR